jgi:hypothetical protein
MDLQMQLQNRWISQTLSDRVETLEGFALKRPHDDSIKGTWFSLAQLRAAFDSQSIQTMMNCIDNSGAAIVECVKVMKMKRAAKIGPLPSPRRILRPTDPLKATE